MPRGWGAVRQGSGFAKIVLHVAIENRHSRIAARRRGLKVLFTWRLRRTSCRPASLASPAKMTPDTPSAVLSSILVSNSGLAVLCALARAARSCEVFERPHPAINSLPQGRLHGVIL